MPLYNLTLSLLTVKWLKKWQYKFILKKFMMKHGVRFQYRHLNYTEMDIIQIQKTIHIRMLNILD